MIKRLWLLAGAWSLALGWWAASPALARPAAQDAVQAMIERMISQDKLTGDRAVYFQRLTALLFEYLRTTVPDRSLKALCRAGSTSELGRLLTEHLGQSVLDFGEKMFGFFETRAAADKTPDLKTWKTAETAHFAFFVRPGSQAEKDLDLIKRSAEEAYAAIVSCLGLEAETEKTFAVLKTDTPPGLGETAISSPAGRISVFLHPLRTAKALRNSMGNMSFGATIVKDPGREKGSGRLTAQVNVLYFNAFSLTVLHHEIAHAALFLGHYNPDPLAAQPLQGQADLKKAFFAGYKSIPPFLHEGVGDYVVYFQSFYKSWPVLPPPGEIILSLTGTKSYVPLDTLIREGVKFRARHHKAYSLEAASVIDYLLRNHGREKLRAWLLAPEADGRQAFEDVYGFPVKELEKRWLAALKNSANPGI